MSAASAVEPLRAANLLSERQLYDLSFISAKGGWMRSSVSGAFETVPISEAASEFDILFVVAGRNLLSYRDDRILAGCAVSPGRECPWAGSQAERSSWLRFTSTGNTSMRYGRCTEALIERRLFVMDCDRFTCVGGMARWTWPTR